MTVIETLREKLAALSLTEAQAQEVLATWLCSGLLKEVPYRDEAQRKTRTGLSVNNALRPTE